MNADILLIAYSDPLNPHVPNVTYAELHSPTSEVINERIKRLITDSSFLAQRVEIYARIKAGRDTRWSFIRSVSAQEMEQGL